MSASDDALRDDVLAALARVIDPELRQDLVTAKMIRELVVERGRIRLDVELTTPACPLKEKIEADVRAAIAAMPDVKDLALTFSARVRASAAGADRGPVPGIANVIAVGSGKGGVGKSTVAANLAVALAQAGARVGLLDCDIYGPSVPKLLGITDAKVEARGGRMVPIEVETDGGPLFVMSMGFLVGESQPVVWRGPMLHKVLQQFLHDVTWGELDYLVVDLPPGTGDVQISLCQIIPLTGAVLVTTPQDVALLDVRKAAAMFAKVGVPILGVVENMASFECPSCHARHDVFGTGGGEALARELGAPLLGSVPLDAAVRVGGDAGRPAVVDADDRPAGRALDAIAKSLAGLLSVRARQGALVVELPVLR